MSQIDETQKRNQELLAEKAAKPQATDKDKKMAKKSSGGTGIIGPTDGYFSDHLHEGGFEKGREQRWEADGKNGQSALKDMKKNPGNAEVIAKGKDGTYRDASKHTAEQNKSFGTNYKPEDADKVKSKTVESKNEITGKPIENVSVHGVRNNPSSNLYQGEHLKLKDEKISTSKHHFNQSKEDVTSEKFRKNKGDITSSPLSKNKNSSSPQTNSPNSGAKKNASQSALSQKNTNPTSSQSGSSGKGLSALKGQSGNSSVAKPTTGGAAKTSSPSTSNTNSSSKSKSR